MFTDPMADDEVREPPPRRRRADPFVRGAIATGVLALLTSAALSYVRSIPRPSPGRPITNARDYGANLAALRRSRARWPGVVHEGVHEAAARLADTFVESRVDDELRDFLRTSEATTATAIGRFVAVAKRFSFYALQRYLGWSWPDASGFVRRAKLYVASEDQFRTLLLGENDDDEKSKKRRSEKPTTLLDIGSGRGTDTAKVAAVLEALPENVVCVETSTSMRRHLAHRGYRAVDSLGDNEISSFDTVAVLNVLDRCDDPVGLLSAAVDRLGSGGQLLLATVVPFRGKVHEGRLLSKWGKAAGRRPRHPLALDDTADKGDASDKFESRLSAFLEAVLRSRPELELVRWTRLPYVSSGDVKRTHYTMNSALMVLRINK